VAGDARRARGRGSIATCARADRRDRNDALVASTSSGSSTAGDGNEEDGDAEEEEATTRSRTTT